MRRNLQLFLYYSLVALVLLVALPYMVKEHFVGTTTSSIGGYTVATQRNAAASRAVQNASASQRMTMGYIFIGLLLTGFFGWIWIQWYTNSGFFEKNKLVY
jgi:hypothetical protein